MSKAVDLTGQRFGKLVVQEFAYSNNGAHWECKCDCGNTVIVSGSHLRAGQGSCGCMEGKVKDITGQRFGRLVAVRSLGFSRRKQMWECKCDCGNTIKATTSQLTTGHTRSCGCLYRETLHTINYRHGERCRIGSTRLYGIWKSMRGRCNCVNHTSYKYYGARGIKVCPEWDDYTVFRAWAMDNGYEDDLSIDRIDANLDYCPENCRWVSLCVQANNKRNSHNITINGVTHTLSVWSRISGVYPHTILSRIKRGWSVKDAVFKPINDVKCEETPDEMVSEANSSVS